MSTLFSRRFARTTAELAIRTAAQSAAATLVGLGTGLIDTDWVGVVSTAGMAGLIALLMNVGGREVESWPSDDPELGI